MKKNTFFFLFKYIFITKACKLPQPLRIADKIWGKQLIKFIKNLLNVRRYQFILSAPCFFL